MCILDLQLLLLFEEKWLDCLRSKVQLDRKEEHQCCVVLWGGTKADGEGVSVPARKCRPVCSTRTVSKKGVKTLH